MSSGKLLLGILAGLAIGATAGILLAPDKGSNTRKKISKKGKAYVDQVGGEFNSIIENITSKVEQLKSEAAHIMENGKTKAESETAQNMYNKKA
jgi:gas vesicle protein